MAGKDNENNPNQQEILLHLYIEVILK